jgi:hypothetical protein
MEKTLAMELADNHKLLSHFVYSAIYRGELSNWHTEGCAFRDSVENRCDCVLIDFYRLVKNWKRP